MVCGNKDVAVNHHLQQNFKQLATGKAFLQFWKIKTPQTVHETSVTVCKKMQTYFTMSHNFHKTHSY